MRHAGSASLALPTFYLPTAYAVNGIVTEHQSERTFRDMQKQQWIPSLLWSMKQHGILDDDRAFHLA